MFREHCFHVPGRRGFMSIQYNLHDFNNFAHFAIQNIALTVEGYIIENIYEIMET